MKTIITILTFTSAVLVYFSKFNTVKQNSDNFVLTSEIEKNMALYSAFNSDPDTCIKAEPIYDTSFVKSEKEISEDIKNKIKSELEKSFSKTKSLETSEPIFGVLKDGSCGVYPSLSVYMDCEDHNPLTESFGWTGASYVDGAKNVNLHFCIVQNPSDEFIRTNKDYAVLMIDYSPNIGQYLCRVFTNEQGDHGAGDNSNQTMFAGSNIFDEYSDGWFGQCWFSDVNHPYNFSDYDGWDCNLGSNSAKKMYITRLAFYFFPKVSDGSSEWFPNFGISYGVLGRFGTKQGYIFTDDEDNDSNDNDKNCTNYEGNHNAIDGGNFAGVANCIREEATNTRLFFSKATDCSYP